MKTRFAAVLAVLAMAIATALFGLSQSSQADNPGPGCGKHSAARTGCTPQPPPPSYKVNVCHATSSSTHPYSIVQVPKGQIAGGYGHGGHSGDIWASFTYHDQTVPAQGDQSILASGCSAPCQTVQSRTQTESPVPVPCAPPTSTPTTPTTPTVAACPPANLVNVVRGGKRGDTLVGTECRDGMLGHGGKDKMNGMGGNDILLGGRGNDLLIGGPGRDVLRGGFGKDTCIADGEDRIIKCEKVRTL